MVVDPPSGRVSTRPKAGALARWLVEHRTDGHENMSPYSRCITRGVSGSMIPNTYNTGNQILQIPSYVIILYEMMREPRIIPLDNRTHIDAKLTQWMGDARARWEGETLVVETTNFTEKRVDHAESKRRAHARRARQSGSSTGRAIYSSCRRSTQLAGTGRRPGVYTRPWILKLPLRRDMGHTLHEYACHEGNRAVTGILGGQRYIEGKSVGAP